MAPSIGIALFDGVEELDWVGPWEVLSAWAHFFPEDGAEVFTMAQVDGPVRCAKGARVLADYTWDDHPPVDVLVFPGGRGTRPMVGDDGVRRWVRSVAASASLVTSVCTGALVLGDAGILDRRPATTHWRAFDELATVGTGIEVRPGQRFVDDGDVITSAGVSAGIDMALHLVARLSPAGAERSREVRTIIDYDPEPPH